MKLSTGVVRFGVNVIPSEVEGSAPSVWVCAVREVFNFSGD